MNLLVPYNKKNWKIQLLIFKRQVIENIKVFVMPLRFIIQ